MASDKTTANTILFGIGFLHSLFRDVDSALWESESSYTEASSIPGTAELQTTSANFSLDVFGSQSAGEELYVQCQAPGFANGDLGIIMKAADDARYMGWDPPVAISGWDVIDWTDGTGSGEYTVATYEPHLGRMDKNHRLGVAYHHQKSGTPLNHRVSFSYRTEASSTWTTAAVHKQSTAPPDSQKFHPCWLELPSGELLLWHWVFDTDTDVAQIKQWVSRDQGATWTAASGACLPESIDQSAVGAGSTGYTVGRIRAAFYNEDVMLICHLTSRDSTIGPSSEDGFRQYGSTSLGSRFIHIGTSSTTSSAEENGRYHDIIVDNGFHFIFVSVHDGFPRIRSVGTAFDSVFGVDAEDVSSGGVSEWADLTSGAVDDGDLAAWREDEVWYLAGRAFQTSGATYDNRNFILRSKDQGVSWENLSESGLSIGADPAGMWLNLGIDTSYLTGLTACSWAGSQVIASNHVSATSSFDNSLTAVRLGGWTTETMSGLLLFPTDDTRVSFTDAYLPIELPGNVAWTKATVGSPTEALVDGELVLTSAGAATIDYTRTPTSTAAQGFDPIRIHVAVDVGGASLGSDIIFVRMRLPGLDVSIRFNTTGFRCYDNGAGAAIGSDVAVADMDVGVELIIGFSSDGFTCSYRAVSAAPAQKFLEGPETTSLGVSGSGVTDLVFGHGVGVSTTSRWRFIGYTVGSYVGLGKSVRMTSPDDLFWRSISSNRTFLTDGVEVRDAGSVGLVGDLSYIKASSEFSVRNLWPREALSSRVGFRTADTASEIKIAYRFRSDEGAASSSAKTHSIGREALFCYLDGINWRTGYLEGYDPTAGGGAGAWTTLHTIDAGEGLDALKWIRNGDTAEPSKASAHAGTAPYIHEDEFEGGSFEFSSGVVRRIAEHTAGLWNGASGGQDEERPVLLLEGIDDSEGSTGSTARIWAPRVAMVVSVRGATYTGFRIRVPSQTTATGDFRIGKIILGGLRIFGMRPEWGKRIEEEVEVTRTETSDGQVFARVSGPSGSILELPFTAGMHTKQVDELAPDPDFYRLDLNAGNAVTSQKATPYQLRSLVGALHDEGYPPEPVVAFLRLPVIPAISSATSLQFNRSVDFFYGEASSRVRLEQVQGEERAGITGKSGEVFRVPLLSIRELR